MSTARKQSRNATFLGYRRPDGSVGVRNYVLLLPADKWVNMLTGQIAGWVVGTKQFVSPGEYGRPSADRELLARVLKGLGMNPNVAAVLVLGMAPEYGYPECCATKLVEDIARTGKPVEMVTVKQAGGTHRAIEQGVEVARKLVRYASAIPREPFDAGHLTVGVKCGTSDPFSGIAGNPAVGHLFDRIVDAGGSAFFDETTETIGAEKIVAARCVNPDVSRKFLDLVEDTEARAKATGEDIRTINPVPQNIKAGITTLEEKSLGAIAKSGTKPIQEVLPYGGRPKGKGLHFMDGWPLGHSIFLGMASCGAQLVIYQLGGGDLPPVDPPVPSTSSGVVAPIVMCTGNPRTYAKAENNVDFSAGTVIESKETITEAGERLFRLILKVASGEMTKAETLNYDEPVELPFRGPLL